MAMFGLAFIIIMGFVSNTSNDSIVAVNDQMFLLNCPSPIFNGEATDFEFNEFILNYNVTYNVGNSTGTFFICSLDMLSTPHYNVQVIQPAYGETAFDFIPTGWLRFIADWLTSELQKLVALGTLIAFYITPANFNIGGFTIADLGGLGVMFVISIYVISYVSIFALAYKLISPFGGS